MFSVYVLYSPSHDKIYIGYSSNVEQRLGAHNHVMNKAYTKRYQPWELVYSEEFDQRSEAIRREQELMSAIADRSANIVFLARSIEYLPL